MNVIMAPALKDVAVTAPAIQTLNHELCKKARSTEVCITLRAKQQTQMGLLGAPLLHSVLLFLRADQLGDSGAQALEALQETSSLQSLLLTSIFLTIPEQKVLVYHATLLACDLMLLDAS